MREKLPFTVMVWGPPPLGACVMLQGEMFGVSSVLGREEKRLPPMGEEVWWWGATTKVLLTGPPGQDESRGLLGLVTRFSSLQHILSTCCVSGSG